MIRGIPIELASAASDADFFDSDGQYLAAKTEEYGVQVMRDLIALQVAGHTDLDRFTTFEWGLMVNEWGNLIAKLEVAKEAQKHASHNLRD